MTTLTISPNVTEQGLIVRECELQQDAGPEAITGLTSAYIDAKQAANNWPAPISGLQVEELVKWFGKLVKPAQNTKGWRQTPVRFAGGNHAINADSVPHAMFMYCEAFAEQRLGDADEAYYHFERIHPFEDGNGRVGWLLWLLYHFVLTGEWREALPPEFAVLQTRGYR